MTKRMLIDATHAEETRVVVLDGNRLEDFDVETSTKRQLKGNIYLAKVVRVEPSLQAAFVEYGGNRHGFLAFSEIHPDYYQIPVADRQRLIEQEAEEARREEEEDEHELALAPHSEPIAAPAEPADDSPVASEPEAATPDGDAPMAAAEPEPVVTAAAEAPATNQPTDEPAADEQANDAEPSRRAQPLIIEPETLSGPLETVEAPAETTDAAPDASSAASEAPASFEAPTAEPAMPEQPGFASETIDESGATAELLAEADGSQTDEAPIESESYSDQPFDDRESGYDAYAEPEAPPPETVGGEPDSADEQRERRSPPRFLRNYKIQEVIRRRQILLVQVVKEERGTKGAALTTYLSLAGRFSVLMPNSPRGGGISRKITAASDRRRLKEVTAELAIPKGMGLIVRTAGANRPKAEIKRDCEYLLRLWDDIREHTMKSVAPALIYEEASLIKRAIRDVYSRDIDDIQVDGEEGWHAAHEFMRMLMPSHAKKVQLWRDPSQPLFTKYQVEAQLDGMLQPTVQLRSGGYLVINQAEALVAIDVNSGRSTRERNVEETALRTNLEAADEVARQLRLRDLAGLIVIDFIDMEQKKHNAMVERRIKEALKNDRARIQVGHISHFGLLEMSRQRLRPSLAETSFILCPHCGGTGHVRGTENAAIHVLRGIEDEGSKRRSAEIVVHAATPVALYILNHKRDRLGEIEHRYAMRVVVLGDDTQLASQYRIDRVRTHVTPPPIAAITPEAALAAAPPPVVEIEEDDEVAGVDDDDTDAEDEAEDATATAQAETGEDAAESAERQRRRRRRRRRGRREDAAPTVTDAEIAAEPAEAEAEAGPSIEDELASPEAHVEGVPEHAEPAAEDDGRARRRGRRGGRRRRREDGEPSPFAAPGAEQPDLPPVYVGPTPANPFGGHAFDIFDVLDQVEASAAARPEPAPVTVSAPAAEPIWQAEAEPTTSPAPAAEQAEFVNAAAPEPAPAEMAASETAIAVPVPVEAPESAPAESAPAESAAHVESAPAEAMPAEPAQPDGEPIEMASEIAAEPAIKPIIIGSDEPPAEKKRGWWRR